jgi:hypothetical protein
MAYSDQEPVPGDGGEDGQLGEEPDNELGEVGKGEGASVGPR